MVTYQEAGRSEGLEGETLRRFINYMTTRWAGDEKLNCCCGYAQEWARRFKGGREFSASDFTGQTVLELMEVE